MLIDDDDMRDYTAATTTATTVPQLPLQSLFMGWKWGALGIVLQGLVWSQFLPSLMEDWDQNWFLYSNISPKTRLDHT